MRDDQRERLSTLLTEGTPGVPPLLSSDVKAALDYIDALEARVDQYIGMNQALAFEASFRRAG